MYVGTSVSLLGSRSVKPFQKFVVGDGWVGWWSKGILQFPFGPILGLRLEAGTKLNN